MSATLKSFDLNDDSIPFRKIRSPKLRNLNRRDQNDSDFNGNGHYEEDIEFDDTRMDIDNMKPNSSFNDENMSDNRRSGHDSFQLHDYVMRDTTTKVPLKDSNTWHCVPSFSYVLLEASGDAHADCVADADGDMSPSSPSALMTKTANSIPTMTSNQPVDHHHR